MFQILSFNICKMRQSKVVPIETALGVPVESTLEDCFGSLKGYSLVESLEGEKSIRGVGCLEVESQCVFNWGVPSVLNIIPKGIPI